MRMQRERVDMEGAQRPPEHGEKQEQASGRRYTDSLTDRCAGRYTDGDRSTRANADGPGAGGDGGVGWGLLRGLVDTAGPAGICPEGESVDCCLRCLVRQSVDHHATDARSMSEAAVARFIHFAKCMNWEGVWRARDSIQ